MLITGGNRHSVTLMRFAHGILELRQLRLRLSDFFYVRLRREGLEKCVSGECKGEPLTLILGW